MSETTATRQEHYSSKPKGWHSKRHQTDEAHAAARKAWQANRGPKARQERATARNVARAQRTPVEQLVLLDERGVAATRERARLIKAVGLEADSHVLRQPLADWTVQPLPV